ncbi:hypothetical protein LCGC14_2636000 [marine sediment metagenome]|uniref:Myo-inositol-1-phosphate synthase GAPDH-like domain-containing protein n=1 Tax=marine sediment metagenome TaxID=412755 RepID=A0A0F8ZYR5_9ZZZZ
MSTRHGFGNGALRQTGEVRVAIVGVGNCASSFVQGVEYYKDADPTNAVPGLMHVDLGGYHVRDITFSAAFDIDVDKVGKDLSEAIWRGQNNTLKLCDVQRPGDHQRFDVVFAMPLGKTPCVGFVIIMSATFVG